MNGATRVSVTPDRNRSIFNKIAAKLAEQGFTGVIQPGRLRTEVYTANGTNVYDLSLKENSPKLASGANRELRLKDQDAFIITRARVMVLKETIAGPVGHEHSHLFNDANEFPDEVGGFQNAHMRAIWNGSLSLKVGDTTYLDDFPIEKSYTVRTQQQTGSLKSERLADDGWFDITPQYGLQGFSDNTIKFNLKNVNASHKIQYNATSKVVLVFEFEGFKITGAGTGKLDLNFKKLN